MKKKTERWHIAQVQERKWWEGQMASLDFSYFARFASELIETLRGLYSITDTTRILEIGSGPAGIVTHIDSDFRIGIDPLEQFYGRIEKCRSNRDKNVRYLAGKGECLPFLDDSFDLIIIDNILDHCEDIDAVMKEIRRVLTPGNIIYLRNFTTTQWGFFLADMLELFRIDRGHPNHFREKDLCRLFSRHHLKMIYIKRRGFLVNTGMLFSSKKISAILRALSFSMADKVLFVLRNVK